MDELLTASRINSGPLLRSSCLVFRLAIEVMVGDASRSLRNRYLRVLRCLQRIDRKKFSRTQEWDLLWSRPTRFDSDRGDALTRIRS